MAPITMLDFDVEYEKQLAKMKLFDDAKEKKRVFEEATLKVVEQETNIEGLKKKMAESRLEFEEAQSELSIQFSNSQNACWNDRYQECQKSLVEVNYFADLPKICPFGPISSGEEGIQHEANINKRWNKAHGAIKSLEKLMDMVKARAIFDAAEAKFANRSVRQIKEEEALEEQEKILLGLKASAISSQQAFEQAKVQWREEVITAEKETVKTAVSQAIEEVQPLINIGRSIRQRKLEWYKAEDAQDKKFIESGDLASHYGKALADALVCTERYKPTFIDIYGVEPELVLKHRSCSRLMEVLNCGGGVNEFSAPDSMPEQIQRFSDHYQKLITSPAIYGSTEEISEYLKNIPAGRCKSPYQILSDLFTILYYDHRRRYLARKSERSNPRVDN